MEGSFMDLWTAWKIAHPFWTLFVFQISGALGMFIHFLKQKVKGETIDDIKSYFKEHPKETIIATITVIIAVFGCFLMDQGVVAAFGLGYLGDSALNKGNDS